MTSFEPGSQVNMQLCLKAGFQMPDELALSYVLIMPVEPRLSFLCWLGTKSWTVPFCLAKCFSNQVLILISK